MAITNTRTVQRIEIYPGDDLNPDPRIMVVYEYLFDDTEDDQLPITSQKTKYLTKETSDGYNENGEPISVRTDISGEDSLVQSVANTLWA